VNNRTITISNSDDLIDVSDIIDQVQYLKANHSKGGEYDSLMLLLGELRGNGGDVAWGADWYPATLIRDSYFVAAMRDLLDDIGDLPRDLPNYIAIDWAATARNLRVDYTSVEFDGVTYWYR
jgi:hypothetical protein